MSSPTDARNEALKRLSEMRMELVETVLGSAVVREANIDIDLAQDTIRQETLKNFIRGLSILYYYSFMQSFVEEAQWNDIKRFSSRHRANLGVGVINWNWFDIFKYVRDCFGHDWQGSLFPSSQSNTTHFLSILRSSGDLPEVKVSRDNKIILGKDAPFQCLQVVRTVLEVANIAT